jgi:Phage tail assembly chaperone protein
MHNLFGQIDRHGILLQVYPFRRPHTKNLGEEVLIYSGPSELAIQVLNTSREPNWKWNGAHLVQPSAEEIARFVTERSWREIRQKRDELLKASDFAMLPDAPVTEAKREEWIQYRRLLRELPERYSHETIQWPRIP